MSDQGIGECLGCHLRPEKLLLLSCLHIVCPRCLNNTNECPQCHQISTELSITLEKKLCIGCKKNSEAVIKCRDCFCAECRNRPSALIDCSDCSWICSDCVTYHEELNVYYKHVLEREKSQEEIRNEINVFLQKKWEELQKEENEWKTTVESDLKDIIELEKLEEKLKKWTMNVQQMIIEKMKDIVGQKESNEKVINCFNNFEKFVNEIMPKVTAEHKLKQFLINKLNEHGIEKRDNEENNTRKVVTDLIVDISKLGGYVKVKQEQYEQEVVNETNGIEECPPDVNQMEIFSVSDLVIQFEVNEQIGDIQLSENVREESETNRDVLVDNAESFLIVNPRQDQAVEEEEVKETREQEDNGEDVNNDMEENEPDFSDKYENDKDWEYPSAEEDEEDDNYELANSEFICKVCQKCFRSKGGLGMHRKIHRRAELSLNSHKLIHTSSEKRYVCDRFGCDKAFYRKWDLNHHKQTVHNRGKRFKCNHKECGKTFKTKCYADYHMETVHNNVRPYPCLFPGCSYRAKVSSTLTAHARIHPKKLPFKCEICGADFILNASLQYHKGRQHPDNGN